MARTESDREDLIREATALIRRTELVAEDLPEPITVGFRSTGAMSVFAGQDPVYQFDPSGRLRRAYVRGSLFRSQHRTLAKLDRHRTSEHTTLHRHDLQVDELQQFHSDMCACLSAIRVALTEGQLKQFRTVPPDADLVPEILDFLALIDQTEDWLSHEIRARK
jgi:hypothetical protein